MATLMRPCAACGQVDDHPRDIYIRPDGGTDLYHHDCHAQAGCESCRWLVAHKGSLRGAEWRDQVQAVHAQLDDDQLATPPMERDVVSALADGGQQ